MADLQPGLGCRVPGHPTRCISGVLQRSGKLSTPKIKAPDCFRLPWATHAILRDAAMFEKASRVSSFDFTPCSWLKIGTSATALTAQGCSSPQWKSSSSPCHRPIAHLLCALLGSLPHPQTLAKSGFLPRPAAAIASRAVGLGCRQLALCSKSCSNKPCTRNFCWGAEMGGERMKRGGRQGPLNPGCWGGTQEMAVQALAEREVSATCWPGGMRFACQRCPGHSYTAPS